MSDYRESKEHRNQLTCAVSSCEIHATPEQTPTEREAAIDASLIGALRRNPLGWIEAARAARGANVAGVEGEEVEASLVRIGATWDAPERLWRAPA